MKTVGFVISDLVSEKRRGLLPEDIKDIKHHSKVYVEAGYGEVLGINDIEYEEMGVQICSHEEALKQDIICDLKVGNASYLEQLTPQQAVFGWIHAEGNEKLVDRLCQNKLTVIAWEDLYEANRHVFWENNHIAGQAAVLHAFTLFGKFPKRLKVALIGRGNVSMGAYEILISLGAEVSIYNRERVKYLSEEIDQFDVVVNGVLWNKSREDHLIYRKDLKRMKNNAMIIDVSADTAGAIESSRPTGLEDPIYKLDGVLHYVVDHTPSIFFHSASESISKEVVRYIDYLIEDNIKNQTTLSNAVIIKDGHVINEKVRKSMNRKG